MSDFVQYLGDEGICEVEENPPNSNHWFILYKDEETENDKLKKKAKSATETVDDQLNREMLELKERLLKQQQIQQQLEQQQQQQQPQTENKSESSEIDPTKIKQSFKLMLPSTTKKMSKIESKKETIDEEIEEDSKKRKLEEPKEDQTVATKKQKTEHNNWIMEGIILKIINKKNPHYKEKGSSSARKLVS